MKIVDARKQNCPKPVIMTKDAIENGSGNLTVIVDNNIAKANVLKLCTKLGCETHVKEEKEDFYIDIIRENQLIDEKSKEEISNINSNLCYVFGSDVLGEGSQELGKILMKSFIYTLTETKPYPVALIFLNSAINLTIEGSEVIEDLKDIEDKGVRIVSCGTCLDYYNAKEKLLVGEISNMYDIVEFMSQSSNTIML